MAQHLFDQTQKWYAHVAPDSSVHSWPKRFLRILQELSRSEADIICLQEVEFDAFDRDFLPPLREMGYDGIMQASKRRGSGHGYGVATFWKSSRFRIQDTSHRSRTMITTFRDRCTHTAPGDHPNSNASIIAIVNCHLEGAPNEYTKRVKQLQNTLTELSSKFSHHNLLLCGDMNCHLASSACATYMQLGCIPQQAEIIDMGHRVSFSDTTAPLPHRYSLRSAYPIELATEEPTECITYVSAPGNYAVALDQIWWHDGGTSSPTGTNAIDVVGLKRPFRSREDRRRILATGLPSELHPSDHLPIGCILEWSGTARADDLCQMTNSTDEIFIEEETSAEEKIVEAMELFDVCPFVSEGDRAELRYIITPVLGLPKKGKPSCDQLQELKDKRIKKQQLLSRVSDEVRQILERGLKLLKDADKLNKK